ncbi:MAG: hypothetical protein MJ208_02645 [Bacilli bacterium]|nr:hypothetical protein [Bacilli bacterium]
MKEKMKIFIPLILLGVSITSYGCNAGNKALQLKRETYADKISATSIFTEAANASKGYQMKDGVFQLFNKGTVTANLGIKLAFDRFYFSLVHPSIGEKKIDCQDVNESISNKTTINWSLSDNYAKFSDESQGTVYVKYDQDRWWECFESNKTRKDITELVSSYSDIRNLIFDFTTRSLSVKLPEPTNEEEFDTVYGMDISGFIGIDNLRSSTINADNKLMALNCLSPMSILSYKFGKYNIGLFIDIVNFVTPLVLGKELSYFNGSMDLSQNAYCGEIGVKTIDLSKIQEMFNSSIAQLILYYLSSYQGITLTLNNGRGTADFDFFLNYKNNFIHQEEVLFNLEDINFNLYAKNDSTGFSVPFIDEYNVRAVDAFELESEAKKVNLDFLMNQEVTDTCEVDTINVNDYTVQQ